MCQCTGMRPPNFYSHAGFERAGLRRRDTTWILARIADPGSLFVPVWRNQNLVLELDGGEPRAALLQSGGISEIFGVSEERLTRGEMVFLGVIEERHILRSTCRRSRRRSTCCVPRRWPHRVSRPLRCGSPICARSGRA